MSKPNANARLFSDGPAHNWESAFPIGNGRLGAMIFGRIGLERLQLNDDTLWSGASRDFLKSGAKAALQTARQHLGEGDPVKAEAVLADGVMQHVGLNLPPYQPLGDLMLDFAPLIAPVEEYCAELDFETGVYALSYRQGETVFKREILASADAGLLAVKLSADSPFDVTISFTRESGLIECKSSATGLEITGAQDGGAGAGFAALIDLSADKAADVTTLERAITVIGARELMIRVAASTTHRDPDPLSAIKTLIAMAPDYERMKSQHCHDHAGYFKRVSFELDSPSMLAGLPTPSRVMYNRFGMADPQLPVLYFNFARYLMLAASRPGTLAMNLQGIWNDRMRPPWGSGYTININTQMNYWLAESGNLAELHSPLFDLVDRLRGPGRDVAQKIYGARGVVAHHNTDIFGHAVPFGSPQWGMWPMGFAWLALHLWDHYDYGRDKAFLAERALPVLEAASAFLVDYMFQTPGGDWATGPSMSPENTYRLDNGAEARVALSPTMDLQIMREVFNRTLEAMQTMESSSPLKAEVETALTKLPDPKIASDGRLQEWAEGYAEAEPGHRHISHLFGLHPGAQISPLATPDLAAAASKSLADRLEAGGGHTGWSSAWIINFYARLQRGDAALDQLNDLLVKSTLPNLLDDHPPFQIDGNFGGAAGIAEMLLQSHLGTLDLLPALPAAWVSGRISGLRARGGFTVSMDWRDGALTEARLVSQAGERCQLQYQKGRLAAFAAAGEQIAVQKEHAAPLAFNTSRGETITLKVRDIL